MNSINWPAHSEWVFIAQLVEHCSANAEATGSNPVEAPKTFFSGYFRNCLTCDSLRWSHTHLNTIFSAPKGNEKQFEITGVHSRQVILQMTENKNFKAIGFEFKIGGFDRIYQQ